MHIVHITYRAYP